MRLTLVVSVALAAALPARAAERKFDPRRLAATVAPFVGEGTLFVAHVDLAGLDPDRLAARLAALTGTDPKSPRPGTAVLESQYHELWNAGAREAFVVFGMPDLFVGRPVFIVPVAEGVDGAKLADELGRLPDAVAEQVGSAVVVAERSETVERLRKVKPAARAELADAFAAAGEGALQAAFLLPPEVRRSYEETMPQLPRELGGGPITVYTRGVRWAALGVETAPRLRLRLTVAARSPEAAKDLEASLDRLLHALARQAGDRPLRAVLDKAIPHVLPKARGDRLELSLDETALADVARPVLPLLRQDTARLQSVNNLKQLVIAMHNYHDVYGSFPPAASRDKTGKPLLSWRVHLLPFLDQNELYKQFHLDEPWDSDHNRKLIARMPRVFDSTGDAKLAAAGKTTYLGPVGKHTMFPPGKDGLRFASVTDATSNTIFLVDADDAHAVPWTKPEDLEVDLDDPARGLSTRFVAAYLAGFVDGSVHFLPRKIDPTTLRALFTRDGGEVVNLP
jgi:hypothetical protein